MMRELDIAVRWAWLGARCLVAIALARVGVRWVP